MIEVTCNNKKNPHLFAEKMTYAYERSLRYRFRTVNVVSSFSFSFSSLVFACMSRYIFVIPSLLTIL